MVLGATLKDKTENKCSTYFQGITVKIVECECLGFKFEPKFISAIANSVSTIWTR